MGGDAEPRDGVAPVVRRDGLGFVTSAQPNLSASQVQFMLALATVHDTVQAADMLGLPIQDVLRWFEDDSFRRMYDELIGNKREGVKQIGSQVLPLALLELTHIIQAGNEKNRLVAIKLLAQMQGMLITQNTTVDKGALEALREELMRPRPLTTYKTLPNAKNPQD
jgi:hypothetical protein